MSNIKDSYVYVESKEQDQTCIGIKVIVEIRRINDFNLVIKFRE